MSSAWGGSWGKAWGGAWGSIASPVQRVRRGGVGGFIKGKELHIPIREDDDEDVFFAVLVAVNTIYWGNNGDSGLH